MIDKKQYESLCARHNNWNLLMWSSPGLGFAGMTILLGAAFQEGDYWSARILFTLATAVGFASKHLLFKHRWFETRESRLLRAFEASQGWEQIHGLPDYGKGGFSAMLRASAYTSWQLLLWAGILVALYGLSFHMPPPSA